MKEKLKKFAKISNYKILAICVLIIIGVVYYYEDYKEIKIEIPTKDVIVFTVDIPENTVIEKEMLTIEKRYKEDVLKESNIVTSFDEVVGKRTKVPVFKGETINNDRLLVNQDFMNDKENKKEISFQINDIDKALNINKGDFIDIWREPIDMKSGAIPEKVFSKLQIVEVVNINKQIIDENKENTNIINTDVEEQIASYIILTLTDMQIDALYNIDKTLNNIKIAKYKENDFYKIINEVTKEQPDTEEILDKGSVNIE